MSNPNFETVKQYMKGQDEIFVKKFYEKYSAQGWVIEGSPIVNWEILADTFIQNLLVNKKLWEM